MSSFTKVMALMLHISKYQWVLLSRADLMHRVGRTSAYTTNKIVLLVHRITLPMLSNVLFSAFELVGKASDEIFFPSCLAIVGAIQPSLVEGDRGTSGNDTPAVTNTNSMHKQQVTYCDWTDKAKPPQEYSLFPTVLVIALTHYKGYTTTAKTKIQHIHPEQQYACFLHKIKFPMKYSGAKSNIEGTEEIGLNEAQTQFLSLFAILSTRI